MGSKLFITAAHSFHFGDPNGNEYEVCSDIN